MKKLKINKLIIFLFSVIFSLSILSIGNYLINNNYVFANVVLEQEIQSVSGTDYSCPKSNFASQQELDSFADKNKYFYYEDNNYYYFYNKFGLKTIMIEGKFDASKYDNVENLSSTFKIIHFATIEETEQAYNELMQIEGITVTLDRIYKSSAYETSTPMGWGYSAIEAEPYTEYLQQNGVNEEIVVAVIDTGINTSHEMFKNRIVTDGNGNRVGFGLSVTVNSSGYISNMGVVSSYEDDNGHGTHVSGIICDTTPSNVKILPIKCLDANGKGYLSVDVYKTLLQEMIRLKNKYNYNIVSVNMSLGTEKGSNISSSFVSSINAVFETYLINNNILPIVAAGNDSTELSSSYYCIPASCESVVTVSALKQNGSSYTFDSSYSNYGNKIDISAPGTKVLSAGIGSSNKYVYMQGTSMASPHVVAVATLLALDPIYGGEIDMQVVKNRMFSLAIDLGTAGKDIYYGYGMLSLRNFRGDIEFSVTNTIATYDGKYHNISVSVTNVASYTIKYGLSINAINITDITTNAGFKNYTNGQKRVYFKITSTDRQDMVGSAYLQINQAQREIKIQDQTGIYGNAPNLDQMKYSLNTSLIEGDSLGLKLSTSATNKSSVGSYDISFTYTNNNYKLMTSSGGKYIIKKRDIGIKLSTQQFVYGDTLSFNNNAYTITSGELVNNDNLNLVLYSTETNFVTSKSYDILVKSHNNNYNLTYTKGSISITPRPITISISQSIIYGDSYELNPSKYSITSGNLVNGDTLIYKLSTNASLMPNVGTYAINIEDYNKNYKITKVSGVLTVNKRNATLNIGNLTKNYGDDIDLSTIKYTLNNIILNDNLNLTFYTNAEQNSSVGQYYIKGNFNNGNYNLIITDGKLIITTREILVKYYREFIYGNTVALDTNFIDVNNKLIKGDSLNLSLSTKASIYSAVGNYAVTVNSCNGNYKVLLTDDSKIKITPRNATATVENVTIEYGEDIDISSIQVTLTDVLLRDYGKINKRVTTNAKKYDNVGNYAILLECSNSNYNFTINQGVLTITARPISLLIQETSTYGNDINISTDNYYIISGNVVNDDNLQLKIKTLATKFSPVGKYDIELDLANSNYSVTLYASYITISARPINVIIGNTSSEFGQDIDLSKVRIDDSQAVNNDDLGITLSTNATKQSPAGVYDIVMQDYSNKNYIITATKGIYRIYNMQVHILIGNQSFIYGSNIVLDNLNYDIVESGITKEDLNITLKTTATNKSSVGNYSINLLSNSENFEILAQNGTLTIQAKPIVLKVSQSVVYGDDFVYDGKFVDINKDIVNNDNIDLNVVCKTRNKFSNVGNYKLSVQSNNANYVVEFTEDSNLQVTQKNIQVKIGNLTKEFKSEIDLSGVSVDLSNVLNNDELNIILNTNANKLSNIGEYYIDLSYTNANYIVNVIKGKYIIIPKNVQINIGNFEIIYGDDFSLSQELVNVLNDDVNIDELNITLLTLATNRSNVGKYEINAISENSNYNMIVNEVGYVIIAKKQATITIGTKTINYGNSLNYSTISYKIEGVFASDNLNISLLCNINTKSPVGNYDIDATYDNDNYNLIINKGILSIIPRDVKIKTEQSGIYGDIHTIDNTNYIDLLNKILAGDELGLNFIINVPQFATVKKYDIDYTYNNKNYKVYLVNSYYEVLPKPISVALGNYEMTYGGNVDESKISIDKSQVLNNDELNISLIYSVNNTTSVGQYNIGATYNNENYIVNVIKGAILIKPANITVKVNKTLSYGNIINYVNDYNLQLGKIINNDNLNLQLATISSGIIPVGKYNLYVKSNNKNYNVTLTSDSSLQITPRDITVLVGNGKGEYLSQIDLSQVEVDLSQVIQNDNLNYKLSTFATNNSIVGYYDIDLIYDNSNYNVTVIKGLYQISPKTVEIEINDANLIYGDKIDASKYSFECNDNSINVEDLQVVLMSNQEKLDVGTYEIYVKSNNENYNIVATNGTLSVTPRKITIKLNDQTKGHFTLGNLNNKDFTLIDGEICDGDDINLTITINNQPLLWGEYILDAKSNNPNYDISIISGTLNINFSYVDVIILATIFALVITMICLRIKKKKMHR